MRKIVVSAFVSLDGVAEAPNLFPTEWDDDEMDAHGAATIESQDAVILGHRTYDDWAPFWPTSTIEPFASFINAVPKYVATSGPLQQTWSGTQAIEGDLVGFVSGLKDATGGDIGVHGSISVAQSLLVAGLVDELHLAVVPVAAGSGRRLLDGVPLQALELIRSASTSSGKLLVDYRVSGQLVTATS